MTTYQNAVEIAKDKMQQGLISVDEANVLIVQLIGVRVVSGKMPSQVRKALNEAVKNGKLGYNGVLSVQGFGKKHFESLKITTA